MVYENMKQEIIKRGGVVHCGVEVLGIKTQGKKAVGIHTNKGEFSGDIVISTAPFRDMVLSLEELDSSVKEMAGGMKFRNTILVYVEVGDSSVDCHATASAVSRNDRNLDSSFCAQNAQSLNKSQAEGFCDDFGGFQGGGEGIYLSGNEQAPAAESAKSAQKPTLFKDNWIYVHSKDTSTGRITNFANWTKDLQCGKDSAILCLEYWANDDEALWNLDDNALSEIAKRDLLESKLVADSSLIKNTSVLKIHKSYPVYERGYKDNLHKIYKALDSFKDLYFIGRNGSFKYNNQDHSILMGLMCADKILGRECDLWHINTDYDYQEGGKA